MHSEFLSTLSLRRATIAKHQLYNFHITYFYPRSPCGERRKPCRTKHSTNPFLSTLSLRRATAQIAPFFRNNRNFYPRSPCGERRKIKDFVYLYNFISIHALLAESDGILVFCGPQGSGFLSTLSLRRATPPCVTSFNGKEYFYPRSPCGERHFCYTSTFTILTFLSTLSLRRATAAIRRAVLSYYISIHALLAESDVLMRYRINARYTISIHALLAESDGKVRVVEPGLLNISIHALLAESDLGARKSCNVRGISIHALLAESDIE